jgi:thioredoxin 1
MVEELSHDNFEAEVLRSTVPVLVDFWAPWCGPCRQMLPVIEQLADENAGVVKVVKVNTDDNPQTATAYGVNHIPTFLVFKNGEVTDRFIGGAAKARLQESLDAAKE